MRELLIAWALDGNGQVVRPGDTDLVYPYRCPLCAVVLIHRSESDRVRSHFAHSVMDTTRCTGESVQHFAAKLALVQRVMQQDGLLWVEAWCPHCFEREPFLCLPASGHVYVEGSSEYTQLNRLERIRPDAILYDGSTIFSLEVRHTHAVDAWKDSVYRSCNVGYVEITSEDVLSTPLKAPLLVGRHFVTDKEKAFILDDGFCKKCHAQRVQEISDLKRKNERSKTIHEIEERLKVAKGFLEKKKLRQLLEHYQTLQSK